MISVWMTPGGTPADLMKETRNHLDPALKGTLTMERMTGKDSAAAMRVTATTEGVVECEILTIAPIIVHSKEIEII